MRRKIFVVFIMFASLNIYSQDRDVYNELIDSALVSMGRIIETDLVQDSIVIPPNSSIGLGHAFVFQVIFDSKTSWLLTLQNATESLHSKFGKQYRPFNVRKNLNYYLFMDYVREHEKFPCEIFERLYYDYRFFLITSKKDAVDQVIAVHGEYKFIISEDDVFEVVDKKIEIWKGEEEIISKYNSVF